MADGNINYLVKGEGLEAAKRVRASIKEANELQLNAQHEYNRQVKAANDMVNKALQESIPYVAVSVGLDPEEVKDNPLYTIDFNYVDLGYAFLKKKAEPESPFSEAPKTTPVMH